MELKKNIIILYIFTEVVFLLFGEVTSGVGTLKLLVFRDVYGGGMLEL